MSRLKLDIYAYLELKNYKNALYTWYERMKLGFWNLDNQKIFFVFLRNLLKQFI